MTSSRKLHTNRANSRHSTGPKTTAGRAKSARNAFRHGLSVPVMSDPTLSAEAEAMARAIAGGDAPPELFELATQIAVAQIDIIRVRRLRNQMISDTLKRPVWLITPGPRNPRNADTLLWRAWNLLDKGRRLPPDLVERLRLMREGPEIETVMPRVRRSFALIDRYERRALSRRKFAIRAFDEACERCRTERRLP